MNPDRYTRLSLAFSEVLARHRRMRDWDVGRLAAVSGLSVQEIQLAEAGANSLSFADFLRLALGLEEPPVTFLAEIMNAWRSDANDLGLDKARVSDLVRLYRLGYFYDPGDFRELTQTYSVLDHATSDARRVRVFRSNNEEARVDVMTIYVRVGHVGIDIRSEELLGHQ